MEGGIRDRFQWLNSAYTSEAAIFITQSLREIVLDDCDMTAEQKKIAQKKIDNYQTYLGLNNLLLPLDRIYYSLIRIMLPTFLRHSFQPSNLIGKLLGAV